MFIKKISHWQLIDKSIHQRIEKSIGFVYKIIFENGYFYYGSKLFKRRKNLEYNNNFVNYFSSSKYVKQLLDSGVKARFFIIEFFDCEHCCYNHEQQLIKKFLKNDFCLNKSCFTIPYGRVNFTNESRLKMSQSAKKRMATMPEKRKIEIYETVSRKLKNRILTEEHKKKVSENKLHSSPVFYSYIIVNNVRYKSVRECSLKTNESQFKITSKINDESNKNYLGIIKKKELKREPRPQKMLFYNGDIYTSLSILKEKIKNIDYSKVPYYTNQKYNNIYFKNNIPVIYNDIVYLSVEKLCKKLKVSRPYFYKHILNKQNCFLATDKV